MTSEQRRVEEVAARLRGEWRRDGESAIEYLRRIIGTQTNRAGAVYVCAGRRVFEDYEMGLVHTARFIIAQEPPGFRSLMFKGIPVRLDPDFDPNLAQLKEN